MATMQHGGQALLDKICALAESLHDPRARCSAFLDVALAQKRLGGRGAEQALDQAVESVGRVTKVDEKIRLLCDIALAQPLLQKSAGPVLKQARALLTSGIPEGRFRIALTEALLKDAPKRSFAHALQEAQKLPAAQHVQALADVTFSQMEMGDFAAARSTIDAMEEPYEAAHMLAELALAEHRAGRDGGASLAAARRMAESLQAPDSILEAHCFVAVSLASLDPHAALRMLLAIQDEADALSDPALAAHANCQIAAAKAQMGYIEEAKMRAARMFPSSYRDSAYQTIATQEARVGQFIEAQKTIGHIERPFFREHALARVIGWMARASTGAVKKVWPRDASRGPV